MSSVAFPGGSLRNHESYGNRIAPMSDRDIKVLLDPQTSGGLLVAVKPEAEGEFLAIASEQGLELEAIGHFCETKADYIIELSQ